MNLQCCPKLKKISLSVLVEFSFNTVPFGKIKSLLSLPSKFPIKPVVRPLYCLFTRVSLSNILFSRLILTVITEIKPDMENQNQEINLYYSLLLIIY